MLNLKRSRGLLQNALTAVMPLLLISAPVIALDIAAPEREGISAERLTRVQQHMEKALRSGEMIGGVGLLARNGSVVYLESYGNADQSPLRPMSADSVFRIYSMSKPITSVAVLMLYEEGHFSLNDPIARYLPDLANLTVALSTGDSADQQKLSDGTDIRQGDGGDSSGVGRTRKASRQPTIKDLLSHTAGFTYGLLGDSEVDNLYRDAGLGLLSQMTLEEFVRRLGKLPLQYDPGSRWHYSVATDVLGRLVEVISGKPFEEFLEEQVFKPLEMKDTGFTLSENARERLTQLYSTPGVDFNDPKSILGAIMRPTELVEADPDLDDNYQQSASFKSGGGGLLSTIGDYFRFCQMLLNGGELDGVRLLSPKTVQLMISNHLSSTDDVQARGGTGFGLGVAVAVNQAAIGELGSEGEFNWGGAAGTKFWIDPREQFIGIFMTQSIPHSSQIGQDFKRLGYQAITDSYMDNVPAPKPDFWQWLRQ